VNLKEDDRGASKAETRDIRGFRECQQLFINWICYEKQLLLKKI
jgi:hypothetical protein